MVLLWVALSMAAKDALGTLLVVAEAKGRSRYAGALDALGDLADVLCTLYGVGEIIVHGWSLSAIEILVVMMATSLLGTTFWTWVGKKIIGESAVPPHGWWACPWCRAVTSGTKCRDCDGPRTTRSHS